MSPFSKGKVIKIKIGVITSAYPEFEDDPHGIFVHRLMREVVKEGHQVSVLAPHTGGKTKYTMDGVQVEKFHYFYPKKFEKLAGRVGMIDNVKEGFLVKFQVLTFLFFNVVYSLMRFGKMDVIHVQWPIPNGMGAYFLKKIHGIPYINTIYGEEVYLSNRYHTVWALKMLVNNSSKTVTISSATLKSCIDVALNEEKLEIIPFGVDTEFFRPIDVPKNENVFQILSVGYLIERKGFEYLIRAIPTVLEKHKNVRLKIVGSGPLKEKLKSLIKEIGLKNSIEIIKNVSDEKLLKIYNTSDLFVLPSIVDSQGNTEGLGVVLLEAMACELPVIGSNVGGISDIIEDGETGMLVGEKNVSGLYKSIIGLIENENLKKKLAIKGRELATGNFSWDKVAEEYMKIYSNLEKLNNSF